MTRAASKPKPPNDLLSVRDLELVQQLDEWIAAINARHPDEPQWNRSTLVRAITKKALKERKHPHDKP